MSRFVNIGGAWDKRDRSGKPFLSLKLNQAVEAGAALFIFPNRFKVNAMDGRPDYEVYRVEREAVSQEEHPF